MIHLSEWVESALSSRTLQDLVSPRHVIAVWRFRGLAKDQLAILYSKMHQLTDSNTIVS